MTELDKKIEEAKAQVRYWYGRYMYEECAERGYDWDASCKARDEWYKWERELKRLEDMKN